MKRCAIALVGQCESCAVDGQAKENIAGMRVQGKGQSTGQRADENQQPMAQAGMEVWPVH